MYPHIKKGGGTAMRTPFFKGYSMIFLGTVFSFHILFFSHAWGADYPTKPINLIVASSPGSVTDVHARILGDVASRDLGVPVVVICKGGGMGGVAATYVAKEKPDGYTFLATLSAAMTSNFALFADLAYKRADFVPLFRSITVPVNIAVRSDSPYKSLRDFLDAAKKSPGKLRSGTTSASLALIWERLLKDEGIEMTSLTYKGAADSLMALLGGHIDCNINPLGPMVPHVEEGKVRLLASISSKRNKNYPDVLTLKELGYSDFSRDFWNGFFAPAGLPMPIMEKFVKAFENALSLPDVQAKLEKVGIFPGYMGPKEFADFIDEEYRFYMRLAKEKR
jgi:tripartite-type tricarboxylate transporter receptor subunit TctC